MDWKLSFPNFGWSSTFSYRFAPADLLSKWGYTQCGQTWSCPYDWYVPLVTKQSIESGGKYKYWIREELRYSVYENENSSEFVFIYAVNNVLKAHVLTGVAVDKSGIVVQCVDNDKLARWLTGQKVNGRVTQKLIRELCSHQRLKV